MDILLLGKYTFITQTIAQMLNSAEEWNLKRRYSTDDLDTINDPSFDCDIVLLHISDYRTSSELLIKKVTSQLDSVPLLVLGQYDDDLLIEPLIEAGASGYLQNGSSESKLQKAVKAVVSNEQYISTEFT
ncbi:hypothetical protein LX73_2405 [Fodinibius salinus]|uniref:Response regulatory domain-containing protein n=1 Tax=Fodinibius salinus TaxID=860790 RepID=A0A5D3YG07_9BACT|nr:response regulator transcription factor [Fodinibius salinus]TYP92155.1 hypothetical protein LX73_2405 [Fodinibius salinus]